MDGVDFIATVTDIRVRHSIKKIITNKYQNILFPNASHDLALQNLLPSILEILYVFVTIFYLNANFSKIIINTYSILQL